jgi:hypothetical protein
MESDSEFEREQEELAGDEAAHIGGEPDHTLDQIETDFEGRPAGVSEEAYRAVEEGGGGQAEGFEQAEEMLIERAENAHGPSPLADRELTSEDERAADSVYSEADDVHTSEDDPEAGDR